MPGPGDLQNLYAHSMMLVSHGVANAAYLLSLHGRINRTPSCDTCAIRGMGIAT
jgi:hypothetical protein